MEGPSGGGHIKWIPDLDRALEASVATGKLVLLFFHSPT
jgi:hypothetical protein